MRTFALLSFVILAAACATGTQQRAGATWMAGPGTDSEPLPEMCQRSELAVHPEHSLDVYFDSIMAGEQLRAAWASAPRTGTVLVELESDGDSGSDQWSVLTDMPSREAVVAIARTFRSTRRDAELPPGEKLQVFLGDGSNVAPRLVDEFRSCPAELLGDDDALGQLRAAADELSSATGMDRIVAFQIDPRGRPGTMLFTGEPPEEGDFRAFHAEALVSARFRPAHVEGIPVDGWIGLNDADPDPSALRELNFTALELGPTRASPAWGAGSAQRASGSGAPVIPCGGSYGISQFALSCRYEPHTGTLTPLQQTTVQSWLESDDGPKRRGGG